MSAAIQNPVLVTLPLQTSAKAPDAAFLYLPVDRIRECPTNVRVQHDAAKHALLTESIGRLGVLAPVLVRAVPAFNGISYELVHGHRRMRAAIAAGLTTIPAVVREQMTDVEVLEVQLAENRERSDLHELDEAEGYKRLLAMKEYKKDGVAKIAEKIRLSTKYVYDRVRLCELTDPAKKQFREGRFSAGHAILLARLSQKDQDRAMRPGALYDYDTGRTYSEVKEAPDAARAEEATKPRSVREFGRWVDTHVRFEPAAADPIHDAETITLVEAARKTGYKIVPISYEHMLSPELKGEQRTLCVNSWKRADGNQGSAICEQAVLGVVAVGYRRGQAFDVCTANDKCTIHWSQEIAARKRSATQRAKAAGASTSTSAAKPGKDRYQLAREKEEAARKLLFAALPQITEDVAAKIRTAAIAKLGDLILDEMKQGEGWVSGPILKKVDALIPRGKTADELVRHLAMVAVMKEFEEEFGVREWAPRFCKLLGVDIDKILEEHAAPAKGKGGAGTCRVCGCTDDDCTQCVEKTGQPCTWVKPDLCSACVPLKAPKTVKAGKGSAAGKSKKKRKAS